MHGQLATRDTRKETCLGSYLSLRLSEIWVKALGNETLLLSLSSFHLRFIFLRLTTATRVMGVWHLHHINLTAEASQGLLAFNPKRLLRRSGVCGGKAGCVCVWGGN